MKQLALVLLFLPLVALVVAAITEVRTQQSIGKRVGHLIPILSGIAAFVVWFDPQGFFGVTRSGSITLNRIMTLFCAVIASSGVFTTYSRRSSAILVALAGLILALFWMFNFILV